MNTGSWENNYGVPSFAKREAYNFDVNKKSLDIYHELSKISEEIEKCRLENS
ncbi:hypothetical protein IKE99_01530 [Candidatus Saccharibacteria bacterium]|nr:hypothetical protein [Candidatus Saccharibacteria bacterium]